MRHTIPALLLVLSTLVSCSELKAKKTEIDSIKNLRALHVALDAYMQKNDQWPQMPEELKASKDVKFFDWWKDTLRPYGMKDEDWFRPDDETAKKDGTGSYIPTLFDGDAFTPLRWETPWAVEREDFGEGKLMLFPDGSVNSEAEYLKRQDQKKSQKEKEP